MKFLVDLLAKHKFIFKSIKEIDKKKLSTTKKINIYEAIDLEGYYVAIFYIKRKSRFVRKNVIDLEELYEVLKKVQDHNFKRKIIIYDMPFCSKAKKMLKENKWIMINASI